MSEPRRTPLGGLVGVQAGSEKGVDIDVIVYGASEGASETNIIPSPAFE